MAERLFEHLTVDNDEAKLDGSIIKNLDNNEDFSQIKEDLNHVFISTEIEDLFYNRGTVTTGSGLGSGIRWMIPDKVPAGAKIESIGFTCYGSYVSNNTPINVEIFEVDNGTLEQVKKISQVIPQEDAGQYVEIDLGDYETANDAYISLHQGRTMVLYTSGTGTMKYIRDIASSSIAESDLLTFNGSLNVDVKIKVKNEYVVGDASPKIVHIGEGYRYEEIQDALDDINDDSVTNPYTFIIHPKNTPYSRFSTIRNLSDSYPWSNAPIRYVSMIGLDKYHCVIQNDLGNYAKPPAEILVNGLIRNLTFIATHDNQDASATKGAYAVHIDAEPVGNVGYDMQFEDCCFKSDQAAGVGIGLHNACHLKFKNCEFVSTASESYAPHDGYTNLTYLGAFNCHSSTNSNDTDQLLTLENCVALSKENKAYNFATNANCYMALRAFNNTFWCEGISQANGYKGSYCTIYGANHGNNAVALNA